MSKHIIYVKDRKMFYDPLQPKGGLIKHSTAISRLANYDEKYKSEAEANRALTEAMEFGINYDDLLQSRKASKTPNLVDIYEALRINLPLMFRKTASGQSIAFVVGQNREVRKIEYKTEDNLKDALMHPSQLHTWESIREFYNTSELLQGHRDKFHFGPFIMMMLSNWLVYDERHVMTEEPQQISWNATDYAYKKMDASLLKPGPIPTWTEFLNRVNYPEVFKAWVWSIFEPTNNLRQIMWLRGAGADGKSSVQKAIESVIGQEYCYSMKERDEEKQWFQHNVYTKVLVNYADCKNRYLVSHSNIKQLTGGDTTSIEGKGENAFTGKIYSKLFVTSNLMPNINPNSKAHTSRMIKLEVQGLDDAKKDAQFETRLQAEIYPFLFQCKAAYEKHISKGNDALILPPALYEQMIADCASESYMHVQNFMTDYLEFGSEYYCSSSDLNYAFSEYLITENNYKSTQAAHVFAELTEELEAQGLFKKQTVVGKRADVGYYGFRLRSKRSEA